MWCSVYNKKIIINMICVKEFLQLINDDTLIICICKSITTTRNSAL